MVTTQPFQRNQTWHAAKTATSMNILQRRRLTNMHTHTCTRARARAHTHTHMCVHTRTHTRTRTHERTRTRARTHARTHTHHDQQQHHQCTYTLVKSFRQVASVIVSGKASSAPGSCSACCNCQTTDTQHRHTNFIPLSESMHYSKSMAEMKRKKILVDKTV